MSENVIIERRDINRTKKNGKNRRIFLIFFKVYFGHTNKIGKLEEVIELVKGKRREAIIFFYARGNKRIVWEKKEKINTFVLDGRKKKRINE